MEGSTQEICITVKEPKDAILDFPVIVQIDTESGSAIGKYDSIQMALMTEVHA